MPAVLAVDTLWMGRAEKSVYAPVTVIISWGKLSNEKLHNTFCSPNVTLVVKGNEMIDL